VRPRTTAEVGRPDAATVELARESCAAVADRPAALAESFYQHLFELAPAVRPMFPANMSLQHERMSRALTEVVSRANEPDAVEPLLQRMGAAHARSYGAAAEHYPYVGRALARAVRDLSPRWSPTMGAAWIQVYEWIAAHMVLGADLDLMHRGAHRAPAPRTAHADERLHAVAPRH